MVNKTKAHKQTIVLRDTHSAMVSIEYICPYCHMPVGEFVSFNEKNLHKIDGPWETEQVCRVCGKNIVIEVNQNS